MKMLTVAIAAIALALVGCSSPPNDSADPLSGMRLDSNGYPDPDEYFGEGWDDEFDSLQDDYLVDDTEYSYDGRLEPYSGTDLSIPLFQSIDTTMYNMDQFGAGFSYDGAEYAYEKTRAGDWGRHTRKLRPGETHVCRAGYTEHWLGEYATEDLGIVGQAGEPRYPGNALFMMLNSSFGTGLIGGDRHFRVDFRDSPVPSHFIFRFNVDGEDVVAVTGTADIELEPRSRSFQGDWLDYLGIYDARYNNYGQYTPDVQIQGVSVCI